MRSSNVRLKKLGASLPYTAATPCTNDGFKTRQCYLTLAAGVYFISGTLKLKGLLDLGYGSDLHSAARGDN